MQERKSNLERSEETRAALITEARKLFVEKGYGETSTPEIVKAANVTRGALYHHFADKSDLFFAVAKQAAEEVASEIERRTRREKSGLEALVTGSEAYFAVMADRGRVRLLLIEAPSILNQDKILELSMLAGSSELRAGFEASLAPAAKRKVPINELTDLVSAAFDRAALAIANGESAKNYKSAIRFMLSSLARK